MKLLSKNKSRSRASLGTLIGALALIASACAGGAGTTTSPSGAAVPARLDDTCNGGIQHFTMSVTPSSLATPGPAQITVTITNALTSSCNQKMGSAQFTVPADLNFVSVQSMTVPAGKNWSRTGFLVGANTGNDRLDPGQSVVLVLNVNPSICKVNTFAQPTAWTGTFSGTKDDEFNYVGTVQSVEVTGCTVVCTDRHAPAISHEYWTGPKGLPANDPRHGNLQSSVGQLTDDDGTFQGLSPCDHPAYENAVKAYVDAFLLANPL